MPVYHLRKTYEITFGCDASNFEEAEKKANKAELEHLDAKWEALNEKQIVDNGIQYSFMSKWELDKTQPEPY
tara:strand:- start:289 stop:504 length:216 start_codon:yes stop_codon:yes gene_type:complete